MYKKALVTGGAGFIGSHLAQALIKEGMDIVILDDLSMGKRENIPDEARFVHGDVRSREDVADSLDGVDIVFHEAARVSIRSSVGGFYEDAETNLMGTLNLIRCCAEVSVKKIIFASSMAVYADCESPIQISEDYTKEPISPYGISKLASEKYCLQLSNSSGIDCHALRYFNTYGTGQTFTPYVGVITIFINRLLDGLSPVVFGDGDQQRDFIHVSDIVKANVLSMKSPIPHGIFNVGTGIKTSVNDIAMLLCKRMNPEIEIRYGDKQQGELRYSIADTGHALEDLKFSANTRLADRIDEVIAYYKGERLTNVNNQK